MGSCARTIFTGANKPRRFRLPNGDSGATFRVQQNRVPPTKRRYDARAQRVDDDSQGRLRAITIRKSVPCCDVRVSNAAV